MNINFSGVLWSIKACATQMIKYNKKGCLVPVASMSAKVANRNLHCAPYNASKAAVVSLCQTAAAELAVHGIRVNAINPGNCLTPVSPSILMTPRAQESGCCRHLCDFVLSVQLKAASTCERS